MAIIGLMFSTTFAIFIFASVFVIPVPVVVSIRSPFRGIKCYQQEPGWRFWDWGECMDPTNVCARVKNCNHQESLKIGIGTANRKFGIGDEVRGCARHDFCDSEEFAGCDCKICYSDSCNAALGQQKMTIGGGLMMLALTMAIPICGILGHLFMPHNLLMMIVGEDG